MPRVLWVRLCIAILAMTFGTTHVRAATKNWIGGHGPWSLAGNWSGGTVPINNDAVNIVFNDGSARTITYNVSALSLGLLSIDMTGFGATATLSMPAGINSLTTNGIIVGGYSGTGSGNATSGKGELIQSGGTITTNPLFGDLILGYGAGSAGAYTLSSGALVNNLNEYVGLFGTGTFNHSGGSNTINASATGIFSVGRNVNSTGTYNLSGTGVIAAATSEYIGYNGAGTFNQSGGTNTISGSNRLFLGYAGGIGTYTLSAGDLQVTGEEDIGYNGTGYFDQSGGRNTVGSLYVNNSSGTGTYTLNGGILSCNTTEFVGYGGQGGFFNQTGGTNAIGSDLQLGYLAGSMGRYTLSGTGTIATTRSEYVGYNGTGTFIQFGGSNAADTLYVGMNSNSVGTYSLSGGSLTVRDDNEYVGFHGAGTFVQTGGTNTVSSGNLLIGYYSDATGTYTLSGGNAITGHAFVGGTDGPGGSGVLSVSGTGVLNVGGTLSAHNTPGTAINLSGGTIHAAALNFNGVPTLFNWTTGTLDLTTNVTFDSAAAPTTTSAALGPSLSLGAYQTLMVTGNETIGGAGAFALTLNSGSTHHVTGTLTLSPTGTLTQNGGSTLYAAAITQAGGTVNGTLQNQGNFIYQSGQFNGRLLNLGTASISNIAIPSFILGNGVENDGTMTVAAGQTLSVNGAGLDNLGTLTLIGGVISGSGPVVNNYGGLTQAHGTINSTFTNNGVLHVDGVLRLNAGTNTNSGIVRGNGTVIGAFTNAAGGTLDLVVGDLLAINNAWANSGLIRLAANAVLGGGNIANAGTIQGTGTINSTIANSGVIRASGGELDLGRAGNTNAAAGIIQAATGNTVMFLQGLPTNSGIIALTGGAFDNNNRALSNAGIINGYGVIRTSALTNANRLNVGEGNMDVFGSVTNNGTIGIQGGRSLYFFGNVSGSGSYTGTGTAVFLAAVSPGSSPAAVSFGGSVTFAATSSLEIELGGTSRGGLYDAILADDILSLGGTLAVSLIDAGAGLFAPEAGDSFDVLDWGMLSGTFSALQLPTLAGALAWNTSQLYATGILSVVAPGVPGDYNNNGVVDAADYVVWRKTDGTQTGYNTWRAHFGQTAGSGSAANPNAAVPEPTTLVLLMFTAAGSRLRRRLSYEFQQLVRT